MRHNASRQGRAAETLVEGWLARQGLETLDRNWRCREGELDLVMLDGDTLCFVEVKYRRRRAMVDPAASVDLHKQKKLIMAAALWLGAHESLAHLPCRFDVIAVSPSETASGATLRNDAGSHYEYRWLKNAFLSE